MKSMRQLTFVLLALLVGVQSAHLLASEAPATANKTTLSAYGYDEDVFPLLPGPHLFMDWRYVSDGKAVWVGPDKQPMPIKQKSQKAVPEAERGHSQPGPILLRHRDRYSRNDLRRQGLCRDPGVDPQDDTYGH